MRCVVDFEVISTLSTTMNMNINKEIEKTSQYITVHHSTSQYIIAHYHNQSVIMTTIIINRHLLLATYDLPYWMYSSGNCCWNTLPKGLLYQYDSTDWLRARAFFGPKHKYGFKIHYVYFLFISK